MADLRLTDLTQATGVTFDDLIHIVITGDTTQYSGGSSYKATVNQVFDSLSGYCLSDLNVTNIHSCSPLNINPLDEGEVYFGSTSGITLDVTNKRIGINTSAPQYTLDIKGGQSNLYYDPTSVGGRLAVSGETNVPRFNVEVPPYLTKLQATMSIGMRAWDDTLYPDYGNLGDAHLYAGVNAYGLNIISEYGVNSADYIRFYAGQDASSGNTPDIHIQGSGSTRGYVGIGTSSPTEKLEVSGTVKSTSVSATTFTGISTTMLGTKGTTVLDGSTTTAFLTFSGSNTIGGTGYTDFIRVTNTAAGATTPSKTFRINNTGDFEIINNAYNASLFRFSDSGNLNVLGRVAATINYSQTGGGALVTLGASVTPQTILSVSLTTYGNPVMICAYGDAENTGPGYWSKLQLWRDSTALGAIVHTEGSASSENTPFAFTYIDAPAAGTYTYYLKANEINGGNIKFGESTAPILNAREL